MQVGPIWFFQRIYLSVFNREALTLSGRAFVMTLRATNIAFSKSGQELFSKFFRVAVKEREAGTTQRSARARLVTDWTVTWSD